MAQGFYGGYMGNAGALSDLVYRGGPPQTITLPYDGSPSSIQLLAQGIPVGQDLRLPQGGLLREWLQYNQNYTPGGQASIPVGFDAKYVS